jgi:hypothetical protein
MLDRLRRVDLRDPKTRLRLLVPDPDQGVHNRRRKARQQRQGNKNSVTLPLLPNVRKDPSRQQNVADQPHQQGGTDRAAKAWPRAMRRPMLAAHLA